MTDNTIFIRAAIDGDTDDLLLTVQFHTMVPDEPLSKLREVIRLWLSEPENQAYARLTINDDGFNWGDALNLIPDAFWREHGVLTFDGLMIDYEVNHDEALWRSDADE